MRPVKTFGRNSRLAWPLPIGQHLFLHSPGLVLIYFGESIVHAGQTHSPLLKTYTKHASYLNSTYALPTVRLHNKFTFTLSSVRLSFGLIAQILLLRLPFGSALVRLFSGRHEAKVGKSRK